MCTTWTSSAGFRVCALESKNVLFFGPPGTGNTHLSIALAARRGHRVASTTSTEVAAEPAARAPPDDGTGDQARSTVLRLVRVAV